MELKIEHLSKQFKDKTAVNDVNLTLTPGIWGLLGANGAGKTTLMRMIADIMIPTSGAVYYDGKNIRELGEVYRSKFGFLPQDFGYHRDFTVKDYLEYVAALKDIPTMATTKKINHLLDILSLSDVKKKKISNLSGGMKRRAAHNGSRSLLRWSPTDDRNSSYLDVRCQGCHHGRTDSRTRSRRARASAEFHFRVFA